MLRRRVGVRERREHEKQNKPRKLNPRAVMFCGRGHERQGDNPEGTGEFDGSADYQCLRTILRGGADDGAGVVNGERGPESELRLREMQRISDRRENQERNGIQNKNRPERDRHLFFICLDDRANGGDGAAAANRRARRDQERSIAADLQEFGKRLARQERERNPQRGVNEPAAARFQDFEKVHAEAESYNGDLQKNP